MSETSDPDSSGGKQLEAVDPDSSVSKQLEALEDSPPYVGRAAICFVTVPHDQDLNKTYDHITQALTDDPRVESIDVPPPDLRAIRGMVFSAFPKGGTWRGLPNRYIT